MINPITQLAVGALLLTGVSATTYFKGRTDGRALEKAAINVELAQKDTELAELTSELARAELDRLRQVMELEDQVNDLLNQAQADPTASRPAVSVNGVRRLNSIVPREPDTP